MEFFGELVYVIDVVPYNVTLKKKLIRFVETHLLVYASIEGDRKANFCKLH